MHFVARTSIAKKLRADNEKEVIHHLGWAAWTEEGPPSGGDQIIENTDSRDKVAVHRFRLCTSTDDLHLAFNIQGQS